LPIRLQKKACAYFFVAGYQSISFESGLFFAKNNYMNSLYKFTVMSLCFLTTLSAYSYDLDTHFYGTYAMARFVGIRHEVATQIATATQWMDESYLSDPLSMLIIPDVGIKKRRLLHFPGSRIANKMTVDTLPTFLDPSSKTKLKTFTITTADDEFATELFTEGLMRGELLKASAGLHVLEDSFAHAGTISELGHSHFWHHPDRPYVDEASVEKYFKMCRSVLRALVAIRTLLPLSAIDMDVKFSNLGANYQLNGDQLADIYTEIPAVKQVISKKILNDPSFVRFALDYVFTKANKVKYVNSGYEQYLNNFNSGEDTYQAASSIIKTFPPEIINVDSILKDTGRPNLTPEYILSMGGMVNLVSIVLGDLIGGIVPRPLTVYHRFEKEEDGPVWIKELDLRVANMRALIYKLYNKDIFFVRSNTTGEKGYLLEMSNNPRANALLPAANGRSEYVTFDLSEKRKFNRMIFSFVFPKLSENLKDDLEQFDEFTKLVIQAKAVNKDENATLADRLVDSYEVVAGLVKNLNIFSDFREKFNLAKEDVYRSHITPYENNRYYVVPSVLQSQINKGIFKPLLTNQQLDAIVNTK
jgi:hypothetical protein